MMSYKLMVAFALPWALMSMLGSISAASSTPAAGTSGEAFNAFVSTTANPTLITIDEPSIEGDGNWFTAAVDFVTGPFKSALGAISDQFEYAKQGLGWLTFMANAASLNYDFLQTGWLSLLRYFMLAMAAPLMFMAAREAASLLSSITSGVARVVR